MDWLENPRKTTQAVKRNRGRGASGLPDVVVTKCIPAALAAPREFFVVAYRDADKKDVHTATSLKRKINRWMQQHKPELVVENDEVMHVGAGVDNGTPVFYMTYYPDGYRTENNLKPLTNTPH